MEPLDAIYENSTLHLSAPLPLANSTPVKVTIDVPPIESNSASGGSLEAVYAVLDRRRDTGVTDLAARIDEHQP